MDRTRKAPAPLAVLILLTAGIAGCSSGPGYTAPTAAELYRERMRYEYEVRNQPQAVGTPAAIVSDLPAWVPEPENGNDADAPPFDTPPS